jgi:hypothetical protein
MSSLMDVCAQIDMIKKIKIATKSDTVASSSTYVTLDQKQLNAIATIEFIKDKNEKDSPPKEEKPQIMLSSSGGVLEGDMNFYQMSSIDYQEYINKCNREKLKENLKNDKKLLPPPPPPKKIKLSEGQTTLSKFFGSGNNITPQK